MITVRLVRSDEAAELRRVRLAALQDAPSAFASAYAAEADFADEVWEERARRGSEGKDIATFFAVADERIVGLVTALRSPSDEVELVSMWTEPASRREGAGTALAQAVLGWAAEVRASSVGLWVTRGNDGAANLYRSVGFEETGDHRALPSDPCKDELRMVRGLSAGAV